MASLDISPATFDDWLRDGRELAVLDLRGAQEYGYGGPLFGLNIQPEALDEGASRVLPRRDARVVLVDDREDRAIAAAAGLRQLGYPRAHALCGGLAAWTAAGPNTPFNLAISPYTRRLLDDAGIARVSVAQLRQLRSGAADVAVLDIRTHAEFERGHVPGAIHVPGADVLLRFAEVVPAPGTQVLTSCAGLTRAILGAQTLIDAGVPNPVAVLDRGTGAWTEAGWPLEVGPDLRETATVSGTALEAPPHAAADRLVRQLSDRTPIGEVDIAQVRRWQQDPARSTYLLDLRPDGDFERSHLAGAVPVIGGQLMTSPQRYVAVRGARLVLIDDQGARAAVVGHWLRLRGWDVAWHRHIGH